MFSFIFLKEQLKENLSETRSETKAYICYRKNYMKLPEVHFRLKPVDSNGECLIYMQFLYNKNRLFYSFGQKIKPSGWSETKQRVKNTNTNTADGKFKLNDLLEKLLKECTRIYNESIGAGIVPAPETLKEALEKYRKKAEGKDDDNKTSFHGLIDRFISNEILSNEGREKAVNTLKIYKATKKHYLSYEAKYKVRLNYDNINLDFFYSFVKHLKDQGIGQTTIAKYIQNTKLFMEEAVTLGYTNNLMFKHKKFKVKRDESDAVYLNEEELDQLYKYDFSNNKRLERVRDLFIFGCWTGLRFSDYSSIKAENIVQNKGITYIKKITIKTSELAVIPCNQVILDVFRKYEGNPNKLPRSISEQKFNEYVKEVCKAAGFTQKGRLSTNLDLEIWECISSHTARRSFCTNYYLRGYAVHDIMKMSTHKSEKVFLQYIKADKLEIAKKIHKQNKEWDAKQYEQMYVVA